jgi:hypothetical protein
LFSYDRSAVAEAPHRVGRAKQSVAFRRKSVAVKKSMIRCERRWSTRANSIQSDPTCVVSFFILHQIS